MGRKSRDNVGLEELIQLMGSQIVQLPSLLLSGVARSSAPRSTPETPEMKLIPHHTRNFKYPKIGAQKGWLDMDKSEQWQLGTILSTWNEMRVPKYVSFPNCWKFKSDCHRVTRQACNKHAIPTVADWKGFKNTVSLAKSTRWVPSCERFFDFKEHDYTMSWYVDVLWFCEVCFVFCSLLSSHSLDLWWLAQCRTLAAVSSTPPLVVSMTGQRGPFLRWDAHLLKKCVMTR